METQAKPREIWVDWMRVCACLMVMVVHATEPFYLGGDGSLVLTRTDAFWASFFDSLVRCCVPLFLVASSYLQFPLHYPTGEFLRRRAVRIGIPFLVWTLVYALVWGQPVQNFKDLLFNFNYAAGHLWFVYMLAGVYLLMPLLSPWAQRVGKKELLAYLGLWLFTTLIPLIRDWAGGAPTVVYGPSGLPRQALIPLWGEASWNAYGVFYYFSGMIGYLLLGLYFRKFGPEWKWGRTLAVAVPCYLAGFAISFGGFLKRVFATAVEGFPVGGLVEKAVWWETTWCNDTLGVALMTLGLILLFRKCTAAGGFYRRVLLPVSQASYGMYLAHLLVLVAFSGLFRNALGIGDAGSLGVWTTPVEILLTALCSFVTTALAAVCIRRIPRVGKWIVG